MRRLLVLLSCAMPMALLAASTPAGADVFGPISLVSESAIPGSPYNQQAVYAHDPAISGNGEYVAFDGSFGGITGVWRRDLVTGTVEQVAGGDAELPSVSENGQYISFTTNEGSKLAEITDDLPDPEHETHEAPNVYVRDMESKPSEPSAFTVASAVNGSTQALKYEYTSAMGTGKRMFEEEHYGAMAAGRSALSANGEEVAFVTTAISDLSNPAMPSEPKTPALQVAVRNLKTGTTRLVSGLYEPATGQATEAPVSGTEGSEQYGAVYPGTAVPSFGPPPAYGKYGGAPPTGASISADGSTVAWMGADVGEQAPLLSGESRSPHYTEPLWRRIAPGSETPTERVTGGSDPQNPECVASGETVLPATPSLSDPCQGPFATPEGVNPSGILAGGAEPDLVPRLSADGYEVAFISRAPLVALGQNFGKGSFGQPSDVYVANMHAGLTREQALTQLTGITGGGAAGTAPISDFDISPEGNAVAFATRRTQFALGSPAYVTAPSAEPGMEELFDADLADDTLTRVTHGYEGGPSEHSHVPRGSNEDPYEQGDGALSPSFSAGGDILAFSSTASNLVYGDGNTPPSENGGTLDGSDAFVVERVIFGLTPTPNYVSSAPEPALTPLWDIGVTAFSHSNGSVLLYVQAPGSGTLRAGAQGAVVIQSARIARAGPHARRASASTARKRGTVVTRTVATKTMGVGGAGLATLTLALSPRYAALAGSRGGLSATVTITFSAPGHPALHDSLSVIFLHKVKSSRSDVRPSKARRRSSKTDRGS
jgi:hypothetical protein